MTEMITLDQAAQRLGVTRTTAIKYLRRHTQQVHDRRGNGNGVMSDPRYVVPAATVDATRDLLDQWAHDPALMTVDAARAALGVSVDWVYRLVRSNTIKAVHPPQWMDLRSFKVTRDSVNAYKARRASGKTVQEVADDLGVTKQWVHYLIDRKRLEKIPGTKPIRISQRSIDAEKERRGNG